MTGKPSNPEQLCLSIGRPLKDLLKDLQNINRNHDIRKAVDQILDGLDLLEKAQQTELCKSIKAKTAIHEILTK